MDDVVDRVAGADVGVVDADVGFQVGAEFLVKVAGAVAPVGVRAGAHARVHQDDVFRGLEEENAVIEL